MVCIYNLEHMFMGRNIVKQEASTLVLLIANRQKRGRSFISLLA
ncbi:unnamed protein product [Larinioides sclopetarius]|uniref:Uncharacterized protein n=1 Tax=Larinioides sclopetarius TaxID=280406 RepID=A0AAV2AK11_9ARAC